MKLFNRLQTILIIIIFQRIAKPIDTNSIPFIYHPLNSRYQSQRIFYSPDRCHTQQPQYFFFPEQRIVWIKTIQIYKIGNRNQFLPQCRNIPGNKIALCMRIRNYIIAKTIQKEFQTCLQIQSLRQTPFRNNQMKSSACQTDQTS